MTDRKQADCNVVDRLVQEYVENQCASVDATSLVTRVRATRTQLESADRMTPARVNREKMPSRQCWSPSFTWSAMTAIAVVIAFWGGRQLGPASASAAIVLRNVQSEHLRAIDHCYRVQFVPDPHHWNQANKLEGPSSSVLWTRGDRFWSDCTIGDLQLTLGREAAGALWITTSPEKGIRFTNDESQLPQPVSLISAINSMSVPKLVEDVLADFELHSDSPTNSTEESRTFIWARLKPGRTHSLLSNALLEIDRKTNVLVRLMLWTIRDGHPKGTVTYTLLDSSRKSDEVYRLESHLNSDATIEVHTLPSSDEVFGN